MNNYGCNNIKHVPIAPCQEINVGRIQSVRIEYPIDYSYLWGIHHGVKMPFAFCSSPKAPLAHIGVPAGLIVK